MLSEYEVVKVLDVFRSFDVEVRPAISCVWRYPLSDDGVCYVATDAHRLALYATTEKWETDAWEDKRGVPVGIANGSVVTLDDRANTNPPAWWKVFEPNDKEAHGPRRFGMNPAYIGDVAKVERAAKRAARRTAKQAAKQAAKTVAASARAANDAYLYTNVVWSWLGANGCSPLRWDLQIYGTSARFAGLIMPRSY